MTITDRRLNKIIARRSSLPTFRRAHHDPNLQIRLDQHHTNHTPRFTSTPFIRDPHPTITVLPTTIPNVISVAETIYDNTNQQHYVPNIPSGTQVETNYETDDSDFTVTSTSVPTNPTAVRFGTITEYADHPTDTDG